MIDVGNLDAKLVCWEGSTSALVLLQWRTDEMTRALAHGIRLVPDPGFVGLKPYFDQMPEEQGRAVSPDEICKLFVPRRHSGFVPIT